MINSSLFVGSVIMIASAAIYFYVGDRLGRRRVTIPDVRLAWVLFVVWWYALALVTVIGGIQNLLGSFGVSELPLFLSLTQLNLLATCVGLFGLLYYLIFLLSGKSRLIVPLTIFYIIYYTLLLYYIDSLNPTGITLGRWTTTLHYQHPLSGPLFALVLILLVVPQVIGSIAYFTLFFRVRDSTQRYRVLLVSASIFIWFGSALAGSAAGVSTLDWWQVASRLIGFAAALTILVAYRPFRWIKKRLGVGSIVDEAVG